MALPVVASAAGGIPESVEDVVTGLLVPADDEVRLAAAIDSLAADPERARAMGERGRARVLERFTMERMAAAYEQLYGEIVERSSHRCAASEHER